MRARLGRDRVVRRGRPPPRSRCRLPRAAPSSTCAEQRPARDLRAAPSAARERMRVPSPAASTIARQVRPLIHRHSRFRRRSSRIRTGSCSSKRRHNRAPLTKKVSLSAVTPERQRRRSESANVFNKVIRAASLPRENEAAWPKRQAARHVAPANAVVWMRDLWRLAHWGVGRRRRADLLALCRHDRDRAVTRATVALAEIREILFPGGAASARSTPRKAGGWPKASSSCGRPRRAADPRRHPGAGHSTTSPARSPASRRSQRGDQSRFQRSREAPPAGPTTSRRASAAPDHSQPASPPMPPQPPAALPLGKPEFGLDLGSASTVEGLRTPGPTRFAATASCSRAAPGGADARAARPVRMNCA